MLPEDLLRAVLSFRAVLRLCPYTHTLASRLPLTPDQHDLYWIPKFDVNRTFDGHVLDVWLYINNLRLVKRIFDEKIVYSLLQDHSY